MIGIENKSFNKCKNHGKIIASRKYGSVELPQSSSRRDMKTEIIQLINKNKKFIKKDNFENLFRLMMDYQLTPMFGKKGFHLKEHIDLILDMITEGDRVQYLDYLRKNMLSCEEPEKYLKAVQLILSSCERYMWFWIEDHFQDDLIKNLIELSEIFDTFRDQLAFAQFRNELKMETHVEKEGEKLLEDNRFFLYKKTREIKDYFESVLESTTDAVISTDESGHIILFNRGAANMFGWSPEEAFHKRMDFLYAEPEAAEALKNALIEGGGRVHAFETGMKKRNGDTIPVLISASLIANRAGVSSGIVRYIKNITDIKEMENELRRLSEFKSKYLHDISHEIKTPIATIVGFVEILIRYYGETLDINVKKYIDKIQNTCNVLLDMMDTLLDLSKIEAGRLELKLNSFNPRELLDDVKVMFLPQMSEKGIDFSAQCRPDIEPVIADRARIRQVVFNLVSNALKFTPEGGKVNLKIESDRQKIVIIVSDTGIGIPPEKMNIIFNEFERLEDSQTTGAGLGLSLAKRLVGLHNGTINVRSQAGAGSKFIVEIPLSVPQTPLEQE
jgi:PAS domain S-box-containing protein